VPGNARRGRPQGKCHRKYTAGPFRETARAARVKRCGKSAPRRRQRGRQGKPHREQDQVGAAGIPEIFGDAGRAFAPPLGSVARGARQRASQRNGHHRPGIVQGAGQNPAYTPSGTFPSSEHFMNPVIVVLLFVIRVRATATCCGPGTPMADTSEIHGFIYKMH
jgi:hypothetical protein